LSTSRGDARRVLAPGQWSVRCARERRTVRSRPCRLTIRCNRRARMLRKSEGAPIALRACGASASDSPIEPAASG
jgi:hypothetical protein